jgi:hypothetical protein
MRTVHRLISTSIILTTICLTPILAYANAINLYDEPKDNSKVVGTIDLATGIMPIFTPANSSWTKVADPRNGNTGWVKNSELKDSKGNSISFSQRVTDNGNGGQSVQVQYGSPAMTPQQTQKMEMLLQQQQKAAQESVAKMQEHVGQLMNQLKDVYSTQMQMMQKMGLPAVPPNMTTSQPSSTTQTMPTSNNKN